MNILNTTHRTKTESTPLNEMAEFVIETKMPVMVCGFQNAEDIKQHFENYNFIVVDFEDNIYGKFNLFQKLFDIRNSMNQKDTVFFFENYDYASAQQHTLLFQELFDKKSIPISFINENDLVICRVKDEEYEFGLKGLLSCNIPAIMRNRLVSFKID